MNTIVTQHATPHDLRCWLDAEALQLPSETRWRIVPTVGGAKVYDDVAGTVTEYVIDDRWD